MSHHTYRKDLFFYIHPVKVKKLPMQDSAKIEVLRVVLLSAILKGGLDHLPPKFEHIFVAVITFLHFLLCRYFYYNLVAYCVCFKMICEISL